MSKAWSMIHASSTFLALGRTQRSEPVLQDRALMSVGLLRWFSQMWLNRHRGDFRWIAQARTHSAIPMGTQL